MEDSNNVKKLGDALEELNESINNKDLEKALKIFKEIKLNNYSLQIKRKDKFDKKMYNNINLSNNDKEKEE